MKLYYHPLSFPALSILFAAEAAGTEYETHVVNLQEGEQKSPEYLAINPYGRVPAMVDGDFNLSESEAIMRYIARKSGSDIYPDDLQGQAKVDQWMDYVNHHVRAPIARVQFNRVVAKLMGAEVDESSVQTGLKFLANNLPVVEETLKAQAFLCGGDSMTLADVALVAALEPADMCGFDLSPYPTLKAWRAARMGEPFYTNVHSHFGAELAFYTNVHSHFGAELGM